MEATVDFIFTSVNFTNYNVAGQTQWTSGSRCGLGHRDLGAVSLERVPGHAHLQEGRVVRGGPRANRPGRKALAENRGIGRPKAPEALISRGVGHLPVWTQPGSPQAAVFPTPP